MPTFYRIDLRNSSSTDPIYDITAVERDKNNQTTKQNNEFESFELAKQAIEQQLMTQLRHTQKTLAHIESNLRNIDTMYPAPILLNELLGGKLDELETGLKQLKRNQGSFKVGPLQIQNNYSDLPGLYVLTLPEYDTVNTTFDEKAMAMVMLTLQNLGIYVNTQWNGHSYHTWSIKTTVQDQLELF